MHGQNDVKRALGLRFALTGPAMDVFRAQPQANNMTPNNYTIVKQTLIDQFRDSNDKRAAADYPTTEAMHLRPNESVRDFGQRARSAFIAANTARRELQQSTLSVRDQGKRLVECLPHNWRNEIEMHLDVNDTDSETVLTFATRMERLKRPWTVATETRNNVSNTSNKRAKLDTVKDMVREAILTMREEFAATIEQQGSVHDRKQSIRCYQCNEFGHFARNCRQQQRNFNNYDERYPTHGGAT